MQYLKIHDWDEWQSYRKDRGQPPWIKIHRCLMRNMKWVSMSDSERGQLVAIWLLAADHNGQIPSSPDVLQKLCFMEKKPNVNKFIELGFIDDDGCHGDAKVTPDGCHGDAPDKSRDRVEKNRIEIEKKRASPFVPPSIDEVQQYIAECNLSINASGFVDYYESNGWMVGKNKMKNWQAACRTWEKRYERNETNQRDNRSRAKRVSDKLDEIARRDIEENGFTNELGQRIV